MGIFNFFRKKKIKETKNEKKKEKTENKNILNNLISITLRDDDKIKITNFIESISAKEEFQEEDAIFDSQEIIDLMYNEKICFYGFFDWKEESVEFDNYLRVALKKNFLLELENNICNLNELGNIDLVYKIYGEKLEKIGITLCCVDTLSDSYSIMIVKNEDFQKFKEYTECFTEFKGQHYTEKW